MNLDQALTQVHWLKKIDDNHYEMFLDHHSLSTFRNCEQYFQHTMVEGWSGKGRMPWFFAIGILVHEFIEDFYKMRELQDLDYSKLIEHASAAWHRMDMDANYWEEKGLQQLGGLPGFMALVSQYASFYTSDVERLRPIATEVAFGKGREVFLGSFTVDATQVDCYLAGRIDLLMDNGRTVGPMDHKTTAAIYGDMIEKYDPQDGMTGYIFATKQIIEKHFPDLAKERKLNMMWMNFIGISNQPDSNKRFKRLPLHKTDWQLEEFRKRNLTTFRNIFNMFYLEQEPQWNTGLCGNMFRRDCMFKRVHRQSDLNSAYLVMVQDLVKKPLWDPANPNQEE